MRSGGLQQATWWIPLVWSGADRRSVVEINRKGIALSWVLQQQLVQARARGDRDSDGEVKRQCQDQEDLQIQLR